MSKLNGFRASHRNRWKLLKYLSMEEFVFLEYCIDMCSFDPKKAEYGKFKNDFNLAMETLRYKSDNSIRERLKKLVYLGFIKETGITNLYEIPNIQRYLVGADWNGKSGEYVKDEIDADLYKVVQNIGINFQDLEEKVQNNEIKKPNLATNDTPRYLSSSKVHSPIYRTNEEYDKIWREMDSPSDFTIDDMKWIDQNLLEY